MLLGGPSWLLYYTSFVHKFDVRLLLLQCVHVSKSAILTIICWFLLHIYIMKNVFLYWEFYLSLWNNVCTVQTSGENNGVV